MDFLRLEYAHGTYTLKKNHSNRKTKINEILQIRKKRFEEEEIKLNFCKPETLVIVLQLPL